METNSYVPEIYIGENGNWFINGSDTGQPSRGPQGIQGLKGDKGEIDAINEQTPTYTSASDLTDLSSGEKVSTAFGKISKAVNTLIGHVSSKANESTLGHVKLSKSPSTTETGAYALDAVEKNAGIPGTLASQIAVQNMELASLKADALKIKVYRLSITTATDEWGTHSGRTICNLELPANSSILDYSLSISSFYGNTWAYPYIWSITNTFASIDIITGIPLSNVPVRMSIFYK